MRLPVLLLLIMTLIAHAMIRLMPNLATLDSRIHSAFAFELGEAERIHSNHKPQPVPTKMLGQLMKTLSASLANMSSLSRSLQNASDMQKQLLRSLGSSQLVDGRGDYPHYRTSEAVRRELLPQEEALGAGLGRLDSSLSELERLDASTRSVSREVSRLRLALGDKRTAALLLGSGLPEEPGAALPPPPSPPIGAEFPRWAVEGEERKRGAGVLFFAYGGRQLEHFLSEATTAARTFRKHNPQLSIAVVTNNATVDAAFTHHIAPRADLLFPGDTTNGGQNRSDGFPRQWLTRLYYMAHTPFKITWALDSNVVACSPLAAQALLDAALHTQLWGWDIAHASQHGQESMYPHNFNIIFRWSHATSSLMRDWLLLQMRRGVAYDDQKTLLVAEVRHMTGAARRGVLQVGKVSAAFGAAFYAYNPKTYRLDNARVTTLLRGTTHVLHSPNVSLCALFNADAPAERQMLTQRPPWCAVGQAGCGVDTRALVSRDDCRRMLGAPCRLREPEREGLHARKLPSMLNASQLAAAERLPLFRALLAAPPIHRVEFESLSGLKAVCGDLCKGMPEGLVSKVEGSEKRGDARVYDRD